MERYLGEVHALLIEAETYESSDQLREPWRLVDHGEPAEGLRALAWVISDGRITVDHRVIGGIRRLTAEMIPAEDLPPDLDAWAESPIEGDA